MSSPSDFSEALKTQVRARRVFSASQLFAFSLIYLSRWEALCGVVYYSLYNGGPSTLTWSLVVVFLGATAQAASLAEMSSILPIAGAQYHWTWHLAPRNVRKFATWVQGWTTWVGYISLLASSSCILTLVIQSVIKFNNEAYEIEGWKTTLIMLFMVITVAVVNVYGIKTIPWIQTIGGLLHVGLFVIFIVVMVVMGARHNAEFVFLGTNTASGWEEYPFISWNVGALSSVWCFAAFEGAIHMGEETRGAKMAVPRAVFWSTVINGFQTVVFGITLLVAIGSVEDVLTASTPIQFILMSITGSKSATNVMIIGLLLIGICCVLAQVANLSRLTWAWARDGGLPVYFAYIDPKQRVPVRAIVLSITITCVLSPLNIGRDGYIAFGALSALCSLTLYLSYFISISCVLYARYRRGSDFMVGVWNWGRWGGPINIFALIYTVYMAIWLPLPPTIPVDDANMNYCGPSMLIVLLVVVIGWFAWARTKWSGPNTKVMDFIIATS